jgi:hypothetical protein
VSENQTVRRAQGQIAGRLEPHTGPGAGAPGARGRAGGPPAACPRVRQRTRLRGALIYNCWIRQLGVLPPWPTPALYRSRPAVTRPVCSPSTWVQGWSTHQRPAVTSASRRSSLAAARSSDSRSSLLDPSSPSLTGGRVTRWASRQILERRAVGLAFAFPGAHAEPSSIPTARSARTFEVALYAASCFAKAARTSFRPGSAACVAKYSSTTARTSADAVVRRRSASASSRSRS